MSQVAVSTAKKIYKWTDENGSIHYGNKLPDNQQQSNEFKLNRERKGDKSCCYMVRSLIKDMLVFRGYENKMDYYAPLFSSKNFNPQELNQFVKARIGLRKSQNHEIATQGYNTCLQAGFKFCRTPLTTQVTHKNSQSSGSGFFVTDQGHIITNEHVAGQCKEIKILPLNVTAQLVAKNKKLDLALLKIDKNNLSFASFNISPSQLGADVITAGFPYKNLLSSSIKITKGNISSLAGISNNSKVFQITASIQPGNSGGPLIDSFGHVVGVIVSKLNSQMMLKYYQELPQNINFAIKGKFVKEFLTENGVEITLKSAENKQEVTVISQAAEKFTVEINCINQ